MKIDYNLIFCYRFLLYIICIQKIHESNFSYRLNYNLDYGIFNILKNYEF